MNSAQRAALALGLGCFLLVGGFWLAMLVSGDGSSTAAPCRCTTSTVTNTVTMPVTVTVTTTQTVTETVTAATTTGPPPPQPVWSADHETGDFSQWSNGSAPGWDSNCQEKSVVADGHALSGTYALKMVIDTRTGVAGCRQPQLPEIQTGETFIYEAAFFLPQPTLTQANHWNVFQFKSKTSSTVSGSDPIWMIDFQGDPLRPVLSWKGGVYGLSGPFSNSGVLPGPGGGGVDYPNDLTTVPVGQWTTLEVLLDQSTAFDGALKVWHDGVLIYDMAGVKTAYPSGIAQWSVNNYSNGLTVNPYTLYVDDAAIWQP